MANTTNPEAWAAQERLRFIERALWWRGWLRRKDLGELFGISLAQASSDLQRYLEMNPTAARYDLKVKCYQGEAGMRCLLHEPRLEEGLSLFLNAGAGESPFFAFPRIEAGAASDRVAGVVLPVRGASSKIERAAFAAVSSGRWLRMNYASLSGRREERWRRVAPRAFGHDGHRWHLRGWCEENGDYRDFVLTRVRELDWPTESAPEDLPRDEDWETFEELSLVPNPELSESRRDSVAWDFGMTDGRLALRVRRAMRKYSLIRLGLSPEGLDRLPPLLALAGGEE